MTTSVNHAPIANPNQRPSNSQELNTGTILGDLNIGSIGEINNANAAISLVRNTFLPMNIAGSENRR